MIESACPGMNAVRKLRTFYPIYSVIDSIRDLHKLRRGHSSLLLCQPVQSLQRILDVIISNQFID
jgi:hypothetical protein